MLQSACSAEATACLPAAPCEHQSLFAAAATIMVVAPLAAASVRHTDTLTLKLLHHTYLYSISISSSVSMCSDTNEMGTTTRFLTPALPRSTILSSVYGRS